MVDIVVCAAVANDITGKGGKYLWHIIEMADPSRQYHLTGFNRCTVIKQKLKTATGCADVRDRPFVYVGYKSALKVECIIDKCCECDRNIKIVVWNGMTSAIRAQTMFVGKIVILGRRR